MRRTRALWLSSCGLLLSASLAVAQPAPPRPPQPHDPTPVPAPKPESLEKPQTKPTTPAPSGRIGQSHLTLTGCLQRGEAPKEGGDASRLTGGFLLKQATTGSRRASGEAIAAAKEYRVVGKDEGVKLADHVGHLVEVVGRISLENEPPSPASTEAGTSASRPTGSTGVATQPPASTTSPAPLVTLTVSSLKMVASSCSVPASNP